MRVPRIFQNKTINLHDHLPLTPDISHRLTDVLRLQKGSPVILFNGNGYEYTSIITHIKAKTVMIKVIDLTQKSLESPLKIQLGQVISKGEKMDWVIQKSTELGVDTLQPLFSERSLVQLKNERLDKKIDHWQKIAIHAAEQCGRTMVPTIKKPIPLVEWIRQRDEKICLLLDPSASHHLGNMEVLNSVALLIGPEGGLSETEIKDAIHQGFKGLRLGPRILRTETAALAVLSALQYKAGDLGC